MNQPHPPTVRIHRFPITPRKEVVLIGAILLVWLITNIATSDRSPTVWMDEVMYTDPAANLALTGKLTSSAWYAQTAEEFWAGNVPLHQILLAQWIKITDLSPAFVRSFNYFVSAIGTISIWLFCIRSKLIRHASTRTLLVLLLLSGQGIAFSYRSGRPDSLCYMLVGIAILCVSVRNTPTRLFLVALISFFLPWAGLQTLPYTLAMFVLVVVLFGCGHLREISTSLIGISLGLVSLYSLYSSNGVWGAFLNSIRGHTAAGSSFTPKLLAVPALFWQDKSQLLSTLSLCLISVWMAIGNSKNVTKMALFGLSSAIVIPLALHVSGKFPIYYSWMAFVPTTIALCAVLSSNEIHSRKVSYPILAISLIAILIGLPARIAVTTAQWHSRSYERVNKLVLDNIYSNDVAFCDFQGYYAARNHAKKVFLPPYMRVMEEKEKAQISCLIIDPSDLNEVVLHIGGDWHPISDNLLAASKVDLASKIRGFPLAKPYSLQVFRRELAPQTN